VAYLQVSRLSGKGLPSPYRPARFHLMHALKVVSFGPGQVPADEETLMRASEPLLDVLWDLDRLRGVVSDLLPIVDYAVEPHGGLSGLGAAVGTEAFTERFRTAVMRSVPSGVQAGSHAAA
jgi:hypothetical protein